MPSSSPDTQRTMTAVVTRSGGSVDIPDALVDATVPAPAAPTGHDILVEVKALSVNPVDVKVRAALNPAGPAARAYRMEIEILDFYDHNLYNP